MLWWRPTAMAGMVALLLPFAATAATPPSALDACIDHAKNNIDYSECYRIETAKQDKLLNDAWRDVSEKIKATNPAAFQALLDEQRKWIQFKESSCRYYQNGFGRDGALFSYPTCVIGILNERTKYLKTLASELSQQ